MTEPIQPPTGLAGPPDPIDSLVSEATVRRLAEAVARLNSDSDWLLDALIETVLAMKPVSPSELTKQQEAFLIDSGEFTSQELASTQRNVAKGSLQLGAAEAWLSLLCATLSLKQVSGFLGWGEDAVRAAVSEGRLYGVRIAGRLRLPAWQFNIGSPEKLIPRLAEVIEAVSPRWEWHSVSAFMNTPQRDLVSEGRKTPVEWLRDGGDTDELKQIIESDDWW